MSRDLRACSGVASTESSTRTCRELLFATAATLRCVFPTVMARPRDAEGNHIVFAFPTPRAVDAVRGQLMRAEGEAPVKEVARATRRNGDLHRRPCAGGDHDPAYNRVAQPEEGAMIRNRRARLVTLCVALVALGTTLSPSPSSPGTLTATMAIPTVCNGDVPIISFQFGAKNTIAAAGGERIGRVEVSDLSVVKVIDACSPRLFLAAVQGTIIPNVTIHISGNPTKATITLTQAIVSSIQASGSQGNDLPIEVVTFNYATMTLAIGGNQAVIQNPLLFGF